MIINHKYKFIFLKTQKTASTSIEIALSQFSGTNDMITPLIKEDEQKRGELGFSGPRNYKVPLKFYSKIDWLRLLRHRQLKYFANHASASFIQQHIEEDIWNNYFKFCFERNPFDKAISRYYWQTRCYELRPEVSTFLDEVPVNLLSNWDIYTINDQVAVDFMGCYENLNDDLAEIAKRLGLPHELQLPKTKAHYRKNHDHYSQFLDMQSRARIDVVCAKELAAFDYHWDAQ